LGVTIFPGGLRFFVKASLKILWAFIERALHHAFPSPHAVAYTWSTNRKFLVYLEGAFRSKILSLACVRCFEKQNVCWSCHFASLFFFTGVMGKKFIIFWCCFISSNAQGTRHSQNKWPPKMAQVVTYFKTAHSSSVTLHMLW